MRALDSDGDWVFGGGRSSYKKNTNALQQQIRSRLLEITGNCFWNPQAGLDWKTLLGQRNNQTQINLAVSSIILNTNGVQRLVSLNVNLDRSTRRLSLTYTVDSVNSRVAGAISTTILPAGG